MAEFASVQKGSLKLKGVSDGSIKKKKKKQKSKEKEEKIREELQEPEPSNQTWTVDRRTKAERAFDKSKEKMGAGEILKRAGKTHKERIMEFNEKLDSLSEHYDIPKVSWTK